MPLTIDSISELKAHIDGVMERADHHAQQVFKAVLPLVGLIVWKANQIDARMHSGKTANMVWFNTAKGRYAVVFNHEASMIDIREGSQQGNVLLSVDNATPVDTMITIFEGL